MASFWKMQSSTALMRSGELLQRGGPKAGFSPCAGQWRSRQVVCPASKTTRGRSSDISSCTSSSRSSSSDVVSQRQQATPRPPRKSLQDHAKDVQLRVDGIVQNLTPKQAGDAGDVLMIGSSMVVFIWLAMQMFRMYYYVYLQLGVMDMMS